MSLLSKKDLDGLQLLYFYSVDTGLVSQLQREWTKLIYDRGLTILKQIKSNRRSVVQVMTELIDLKRLTDKIT